MNIYKGKLNLLNTLNTGYYYVHSRKRFEKTHKAFLEYCELEIKRCDNEYIEEMLIETISLKDYELSNMLQNIILQRKKDNIIYTKEYRMSIKYEVFIFKKGYSDLCKKYKREDKINLLLNN